MCEGGTADFTAVVLPPADCLIVIEGVCIAIHDPHWTQPEEGESLYPHKNVGYHTVTWVRVDQDHFIAPERLGHVILGK